MSDIKLPIFDGEKYGVWKKRLEMFLKLNKCYVVIERSKIPTDDSDKWEETDLRAINYIYNAITDKQLELVYAEETAFGIISKFDEIYLVDSEALQEIKKKLKNLKLDEYSDHNDFFTDFDKYVKELKTAGGKITEKEKLDYMLNTLPIRLSWMVRMVTLQKLDARTIDYVKKYVHLDGLRKKLYGEKFLSAFKLNKDLSNKPREKEYDEKSMKSTGDDIIETASNGLRQQESNGKIESSDQPEVEEFSSHFNKKKYCKRTMLNDTTVIERSNEEEDCVKIIPKLYEAAEKFPNKKKKDAKKFITPAYKAHSQQKFYNDSSKNENGKNIPKFFASTEKKFYSKKQAKVCYYCKQPGHIKLHCPANNSKNSWKGNSLTFWRNY